MVCWQYVIIIFLFQEANVSPHQLRQLIELALVLFLLTIWIFRLYMFGSHSENKVEFTVSFIRDGSSSSYFSRKLFEFGAYANSLDHLDCSHGALAVFYLRKQISLPINEGSCWNLLLCYFS